MAPAGMTYRHLFQPGTAFQGGAKFFRRGNGGLDGQFFMEDNILQFQVIPEPGTAALIIAGLAALALFGGRRDFRRPC